MCVSVVVLRLRGHVCSFESYFSLFVGFSERQNSVEC